MIMTYWSDGANIFVSLIAILIMAGLGFLLFYFSKKEYKKYRDENSSYIEGVLSKNEINSNINSYLSRITTATPFTLILLDIDHFTNVVNAFGDKNIKEIMENVVNNISKVLPARVQTGRYAVDQFLFFLHGDYDKEDIEKIATDIREAVKKPFRVNQDIDVNLTGSVGVAYFPVHGETLTKLVDSLRMAVYSAKKDGGDRTVIYSSEMTTNESENVQYYNQIKQAIVNKEFTLYYQPIVDLKDTKNVVGAESLIRWNHPEMGIVNPHSFLNVLEQSGDINWVGVWSFEVLVNDLMNLKLKYPGKDLKFSINISPKQLMNPSLPANFQKVLKRHKTFATNFIIEVEEFVIFQQQETIKQNIFKLRELGFQIAVDGFSLDHSTLTKVKELPIDIIKISQNDFDDEDTYIKEHFMSLLIEFATQNNIKVIAEKIENDAMIESCLAKNVEYGQGFGISKPLSINDFHYFVENGKAPVQEQEEVHTRSDQDRADDVQAAFDIIKETEEEAEAAEEQVAELDKDPVEEALEASENANKQEN